MSDSFSLRSDVSNRITPRVVAENKPLFYEAKVGNVSDKVFFAGGLTVTFGALGAIIGLALMAAGVVLGAAVLGTVGFPLLMTGLAIFGLGLVIGAIANYISKKVTLESDNNLENLQEESVNDASNALESDNNLENLQEESINDASNALESDNYPEDLQEESINDASNAFKSDNNSEDLQEKSANVAKKAVKFDNHLEDLQKESGNDASNALIKNILNKKLGIINKYSKRIFRPLHSIENAGLDYCELPGDFVGNFNFDSLSLASYIQIITSKLEAKTLKNIIEDDDINNLLNLIDDPFRPYIKDKIKLIIESNFAAVDIIKGCKIQIIEAACYSYAMKNENIQNIFRNILIKEIMNGEDECTYEDIIYILASNVRQYNDWEENKYAIISYVKDFIEFINPTNENNVPILWIDNYTSLNYSSLSEFKSWLIENLFDLLIKHHNENYFLSDDYVKMLVENLDTDNDFDDETKAKTEYNEKIPTITDEPTVIDCIDDDDSDIETRL